MKKKKPHKKLRRSKNEVVKNKVTLDTSVQIAKFFDDTIKDELTALSSKNDFFSLYFVLYEFKTGLIKSLIDFYLRVKIIGNASDAIVSWSNSFKPRELKNKNLLEAMMLKVFKSIDATSVENYLLQVETVIFLLMSRFDVELKNMAGSFTKDKIVRQPIRGSEDYEEFINLYNSRKQIQLSQFWEKHSDELENILKYTGTRNKAVQRICKNLELIKSDFSKADTHNPNKAVGDAVIAVDSPKSFSIASLDKSFEYLCSSLGKENIHLTSRLK